MREEHGVRRGRQHGGDGPRRKAPPPPKTHAEEFYYLKQMNARTPMVVVFADGEVVRGRIEWYDEDCLKVHRDGAPNLLVFKRHVKYLYKDEAATPAGGDA